MTSSLNPQDYPENKINSDYPPQNNQEPIILMPSSGYSPDPYQSSINSSSGSTSTTSPYTLNTSEDPFTADLDNNKIEKNEPKKSFGNKIFSFFAGTLVFILLFSSGIMIFMLTSPSHPFSQYIVKNTFLGKVVILPEGNSNNSNPSSNNNQQQTSVEFATPDGQLTVTQVVQKSLPSVVSISIKEKRETIENLSQDLTAGTGFIIKENGLIVSNKHVVSKACESGINNIQITGLTHNSDAYDLELLSIDPIEDIAILRIKNPGDQTFAPVEFFDSKNLELGQDVIAIGNVLGELQNTVTKGIVSGLNRSFNTVLIDKCTQQEFKAESLIQTDAAINRGNSGGPLFNSTGQLIGMNTLGTTDAENIGLALPATTIKNVVDSFERNNKIVRPRIRIQTVPINSLLKAQNPWLPVENGELIYTETGNSVPQNSPEDQAGLQEGDIIVAINGNKLITSADNPSPLRREILNKVAGENIKLSVLRVVGADENGFSYSQDTEDITIPLGSASFNLDSLKVEFGS